MESKFTPGPWKTLVELDTDKLNVVTVEDEYWIASTGDDGERTAAANARLIAAAPDLLEALRGVRFVVNADPTLHHLRIEPWWEKLQSAISKALGE